MSVLAFTTGDLFRLTIVKYLATNPERKWANNYEAQATADGVTTDLTALGLVLVEFERKLHFDPVVFDRLRISTWEADSLPYDPSSFLSLPLSAVGILDEGGSSLEALNVCWDVARIPISGRFGHLYYRGALVESEVSAPAGKFILDSPVTKQGEVVDALDDSTLADYTGGGGPVLNLVMVNADGTQIRTIANLSSRGVAVVPFNHTWFNRTSSP